MNDLSSRRGGPEAKSATAISKVPSLNPVDSDE